MISDVIAAGGASGGGTDDDSADDRMAHIPESAAEAAGKVGEETLSAKLGTLRAAENESD